ncbi:hypothetical protein C0995_013104 [Termitomyces sp. Mi166|nr:hypothetical protein C0995_013104 [Termitomyces sp. Mi166\
MAHFRCPTFNTLNFSYIPNLNRLTLASHNKSSRSPTLSPLRSYYDSPRLASQSHVAAGNDDFQSNAQLSFSRSDLQFHGLGIAYPQASETPTKAVSQKSKISLAETIPASRLQAIKVELGEPTLGLQGELSCFYEPQVSQSWSFSSLVPNNESTAKNSQATKIKNDLGNDVVPITFSSLATTSGMSITSLADHLSATADIALQYLSSSSSGISDSHTVGSDGSLLGELCDEQSATWLSISPAHESNAQSAQLSSCSVSWFKPPPGVDPSEITIDQLLEPETPQDPTVPSHFSCLDIPFHSLTGFFHSNNNLTGAEVTPRSLIESSESATRFEAFPPLPKLEDEDSDYRLSDSESTIWSSSSFPSPCQKTRNRKRLSQVSNRFQTGKTGKSTFPKLTKRKQRIEVITEALAPVEAQETPFDADLGTPVFDAHRGIDIDELRSKAERYRLRNPGRIYDNNWLASFAGKLSDRGELINDYRCYVAGCTQVNKRRDHILIHIGSHLDQRPYACSYWCVTLASRAQLALTKTSPSRFLRKNECKRHEASHSGVKPFACPICANTAFVRQDLLKRHTTRAHGIKTARKRRADTKKEEKENQPNRPLKRVKKESNE